VAIEGPRGAYLNNRPAKEWRLCEPRGRVVIKLASLTALPRMATVPRITVAPH
jgi:hypothetical protein